MNAVNANKVFGLIIAAGMSGRMNAFKPLLDYKGKSFLINIIEKLNTVCERIIVVTGYNSSAVEKHLGKYLSPEIRCKTEVVLNENFGRGMFSSLQTGIQHCLNADWTIYHFVDQPSIPKKFYAGFAEQITSDCDWIQPMNKGRKGHPILLSKNAADIIINADDTANLRDLRGNLLKKYWDCPFREILEDIDEPDDYSNLIDL